MNTSNSNDVPSDAPHDIEGVPRFAVTTDEPYPKEIFDSGYVNKAPDAPPSVTEAAPKTHTVPVRDCDCGPVQGLGGGTGTAVRRRRVGLLWDWDCSALPRAGTVHDRGLQS